MARATRISYGVLFSVVFIASALSGCGEGESSGNSSLFSMSNELREEADEAFVKYQKGEIEYIVRIPVLGNMYDVSVVQCFHLADYGFIDIKNSGDFYARESGKYYIYCYDKEHLYVVLKERYVHSIMRGQEPGEFVKKKASWQ